MLDTIRTIIIEHVRYREQIIMLAKSDLVKTYRGAALGWAWAVVKPMVTLFVFWFAFSVGLRAGKPVEGYPYFLWLVAGMLPWFFMQELITGGAGCIRKYSHLVTKMRFPVSIIPTYFNLSHLFTHLILLVITIVLFMFFGFFPDIYYLQIPIYMVMMLIFFVVWSLLAGLLSSIHSWVRLILKFNPVTVISSGYRKAFIYKKWFFEDGVELCCYLTTLIVFTLAALWAYRKLRKEIPDVL